jgi:hypothetical protein
MRKLSIRKADTANRNRYDNTLRNRGEKQANCEI